MQSVVLVLNANFEPINVCSMRRALTLMLAGKADMVANGRGVFRTVSREIPCPSVIRLEAMVHRPRPKLRLSRREVFRRDNYTCQYCGKKTPELTIDHVVPRHLGGGYIWTNIVTACPPCNHRKGGRRLDEARMHLLRVPGEPPSSAAYIFGRHLGEYRDWEPYIAGW